MCAISGIVNLDSRNPVDPALVARMTDIMAHRGPDGRGTFVRGNAGLGHRRLSIIDLEGGAQPMFNEDESVVTVFNGEIYNYADLTADLVAHGHRFRTHSDTETIVHAYEEYGDQCLERFRGMFAIAIWDTRRQRLLLARDRLGIKPLYYYEGPGFLAFASEIKALLEIPGVRAEVDSDALSSYISLRYVPGPRTMFRNIFKLQPGHLLTLDGQGTRIRKYWDIDFQPREASDKQIRQQFEDLLSESVRLRLIAEVPLGVFLSGGIDSSSILAVMSKLRRAQGINTYSVGYRDAAGDTSGKVAASNEFEYAQLAADTFGANHHECRIGPEDLRDILPKVVWHLDEPLADPTCVPLYFISRDAREKITVVLSGEGADEILGGYSIYDRMLRIENLYRYCGRFVPGLGSVVRPLLPTERHRAALDSVLTPLETRYRSVCRAFRPDLKQELFPESTVRQSAEYVASQFEASFRGVGNASTLSRMLYVDTRIWLPDDLLLKADKMTMANALELRVPFLDHKMVEFAATIPDSAKLRAGVGKRVLRESMQGIVPDSILNREKKGFPTPKEHWMRTELRGWVNDILFSPNSAIRNYMDVGVAERIAQEHASGRVNREDELWTLLVFEHWHRIFIDGNRDHSRPAGKPSELTAVGTL
jgi:asparagine synthase (glutamine-hydrolysing)